MKKLVQDGGFCNIFRTVCCIGDSLSSGEFETFDDGIRHCYDTFEQSWGQYIARRTGAKVYNFSRGGLTAKAYVESYGDVNGFFKEEDKCQAYIIALGVNDLYGLKQKVGEVEDMEGKEDTFANYYGKLIKKYKEISPKAKFFFVTMPKGDENKEERLIKKQHAKLLYEFAKKFDNSYVIDLYKYMPCNNKKYQEKYYLSTHLNPMGYKYTADVIMTLIDDIIKKDMKAFERIGMLTENSIRIV